MNKKIIAGSLISLLIPIIAFAENKEVVDDSKLPNSGGKRQFEQNNSQRPTGSSHGTRGQMGGSTSQNDMNSVPNNGAFGNNNANSGGSMGGASGAGVGSDSSSAPGAGTGIGGGAGTGSR